MVRKTFCNTSVRSNNSLIKAGVKIPKQRVEELRFHSHNERWKHLFIQFNAAEKGQLKHCTISTVRDVDLVQGGRTGKTYRFCLLSVL